MAKKVFILHLLPLEYYPPIINLLRVLEKDNRFEVQVFSTHNQKNRLVFTSRFFEIFRIPYPAYVTHPLLKLGAFIRLAVIPLLYIWRFKPDAIMYIEPHSALPAYLYKRFFRPKAGLFIHHHEYYSPDEFNGPGMASVRFKLPIGFPKPISNDFRFSIKTILF